MLPVPLSKFRSWKDIKIAKEENKFTPSVKAEKIARANAFSSIVSDGVSSKRSILLRDASSSINAWKSSRPSSSFNLAYASAWIASNAPKDPAIATISGLGNHCEILLDQ